ATQQSPAMGEVCYPFGWEHRRRWQRAVSKQRRGEARAGEPIWDSRDRRRVMPSTQSRRRFLATLSSAGVAGVISARHSFAAEPPPETTTVRFPKYSSSICNVPVLIIDEVLRAEGFTDVRYVPTTSGAAGIRLAARGEVDFENAFVGTHVSLIDAGSPITILGGLHLSCSELFRR